jgi:DHA3 family macrolide efflux protein-like MFS transporter
VFGPLVGTGPGAGMGLLFVFAGILGVFVALTGYLVPVVRQVESRLPDHEADANLAAEPAAEPAA